MKVNRGWLLLPLGLALLQLAALSRSATVTDDAWISLQHARNLVEGHGLIFQVGERVEGFTNPLWTLLGAGLLAVGASPTLGLRLLGALAWLGLLATCAAHLRDSGVRSSISIAVCCVVAASPALVYWSQSGLETVAFAAAAAEATRWATRAAREGGRAWAWTGVFGATAALLRPEGVAWGGLLLLGAAYFAWRAGRLRGGGLGGPLVGLLVFALPVLGYEVFRLAYYGAWLPNTFYAKVGGEAGVALRGLRYLGRVATETPTALLLLPALLAPRSLLRPAALLPAGLLAFHALYLVAVGGDYMELARFGVPAVALSAFVGGIAAEAVAQRGGAVLRLGGPIWLTMGLLMGLPAWAPGTLLRDGDHEVARYEDVGRWLREHTPEETLVATPAVGAIAWESGRRLVDTIGITDPNVARYRSEAYVVTGPAGHTRSNVGYVLDRAPDLILLANVWLRPVPLRAEHLLANPRLLTPTDRFLFGEPRFFADYEIASWRLEDGRWLGAALRRGGTMDPDRPGFEGRRPDDRVRGR